MYDFDTRVNNNLDEYNLRMAKAKQKTENLEVQKAQIHFYIDFSLTKIFYDIA